MVGCVKAFWPQLPSLTHSLLVTLYIHLTIHGEKKHGDRGLNCIYKLLVNKILHFQILWSADIRDAFILNCFHDNFPKADKKDLHAKHMLQYKCIKFVKAYEFNMNL